jgi:hypothetical protein
MSRRKRGADQTETSFHDLGLNIGVGGTVQEEAERKVKVCAYVFFFLSIMRERNNQSEWEPNTRNFQCDRGQLVCAEENTSESRLT